MQRFTRRLLPVVGATLVFGLLATPDASAQSPKKVITLSGGDSAVSSAISKARKRVNGKDMITAARERKEKLKTPEEERKETKKRLRAQLADADAVVADLAAPPASEDDGLLVEAAIEEGVPVVLENTDSEKMANLTGAIGVQAGTVVIESRAEGGEFQITIVDGPEPTVQSGPVKSNQRKVEKPLDPQQKAQLEQRIAKQKAAMASAPKPGSVAEVSKLTSAQKLAKVEALISEKAFKKGAQRHGLLTGKCTSGTACKEGTLQINPQTFCPRGTCSSSSSLTPQVEWGIYKTVTQNPTTGASRTSAYIVTRAAGRPNLVMTWNDDMGRGYYLEGWKIQFTATSFPANMGWFLDKATPLNANRQASVAYTSGFSVSATGAEASSVSIGFNSSVALTMTTNEFGYTRTTTSSPASATWTTKLQLTGVGGTYSQPTDLLYNSWGTLYLNGVPTIAQAGTDFRAEAIWTGNRGTACGACNVYIQPTFSLQMHRIWMEPTADGYTLEDHNDPFSITSTVAPIAFRTHW